jgi:hypothetical protein
MPGPLTPRHKARCAVMMIRPYKPRDSARSALLTAVRSRQSGLAVHPRRVLHGPAAPDWRGEIRVGRTRTLTLSLILRVSGVCYTVGFVSLHKENEEADYQVLRTLVCSTDGAATRTIRTVLLLQGRFSLLLQQILKSYE